MFTPKPNAAREEVVSLSFADERRVAGHHHRRVRVRVVRREVAGVPLVLALLSHLPHKLEHLGKNDIIQSVFVALFL